MGLKLVPGLVDMEKRGRNEKGDDLVRWLQAVHVAQLRAGNEFDYDGWDFFLLWYRSVSGD